MNNEKLQKMNPRSFWLLLTFTTIIIYTLNYLTPLIADDYAYAVMFGTGTRVESVKQALISQYDHYMGWGGRSIAHFFAQIFIWIGKTPFNFINTGMYLLLSILIYKMSTREKKDTWIFLAVQLMIWMFSISFGETSLWLVGSCNYLWGSVFILLFLSTYHFYWAEEKSFPGQWLVWFFLGIIAGWQNENTSGAGLLIAGTMLILYIWRKKKVPLWAVTGVIGNAVGLAFLVQAPGNKIRSSAYGDYRSIYEIYGSRLTRSVDYWTDEFLWLVIGFLVLYIFVCFAKLSLEEKLLPLIYFVGAAACNFVMIVSPEYPDRATFGGMVFLILAVVQCLALLKDTVDIRVRSVAAALAVFYLATQCMYAVVDVGLLYKTTKAREAYILEEKEKGNMEITLIDEVDAETKYNVLYNLQDLTHNHRYWINATTATYFEVHSIERIAPEE